MGSTRVLADAHWVSDTAGGAALGVGAAATAELLLSTAGGLLAVASSQSEVAVLQVGAAGAELGVEARGLVTVDYPFDHGWAKP